MQLQTVHRKAGFMIKLTSLALMALSLAGPNTPPRYDHRVEYTLFKGQARLEDDESLVGVAL